MTGAAAPVALGRRRSSAAPGLGARRVEGLRRTALGAVSAFAVLVAAQHALRPGLSPARHFVSEYAHGPGGFVQGVAFGSWALGIGACAALAAGLPAARPVARGLVVGGLGTGAVGALLTAAFATQTIGGELPHGVTRTFAGRAHDVGTLLIFAGLLVAAAASTRALRGRRYRLVTLALGAALLAIPAALVAIGSDAPGWGQRGFIAVGCGWLVVFAQTAATIPAPRRSSSVG